MPKRPSSKRPSSKRQYPRLARVNEMLREVVAGALLDIDDERLIDLSVTSVVCSADLTTAVVHYDVLDGPDADDDVLPALEELRPRLQTAVNAQTRLKQTPRLSFAPDPVVRSAERIDRVLRGLQDHPSSDDDR